LRSIETVPLDLTELRELLTALNQTDIAELTLKSDDFELTVRRGTQNGTAQVMTSPTIESVAAPAPVATPTPQATPVPAPTNNAPVLPIVDRRLLEIVSPIVGTFYRSPAPDEPPFADMGTRIQKGQVVCIIEAMKVMNEIESEVAGEVVEILVQNGEPVEYGQVLMRVNPG
jgi:acetyl-CoA carboxylase biotin carboxyl carrier protein